MDYDIKSVWVKRPVRGGEYSWDQLGIVVQAYIHEGKTRWFITLGDDAAFAMDKELGVFVLLDKWSHREDWLREYMFDSLDEAIEFAKNAHPEKVVGLIEGAQRVHDRNTVPDDPNWGSA